MCQDRSTVFCLKISVYIRKGNWQQPLAAICLSDKLVLTICVECRKVIIISISSAMLNGSYSGICFHIVT